MAAEQKQRWYRKGWALPVVALLAFLVGTCTGAVGGGDAEQTAQRDAEPAPTVTVTETAEAEEAEPAPTVTVTETAEAPAPAEPPPAEPPAAEPADGDYSAGPYRITDVQISEDFAGDFAARARVTNTGTAKQGVILRMTVFKGQSVIATLDGAISGIGANETKTVDFSSQDSYTADWDRLEFQIETEF